ncbi:flavodoxin family protein [uncultured Sutterella sp.]|uniref:flavodoxin family protein n=1 Tax=uncultured Sutterella sp. TaxID=286133 RepID=UPI0025D6AE71|nr:flavodoxin family protein [uncultured Sutterella sp.]
MAETQTAAKPLIVISSRTGNTMILGHAICDALPGAVLVRPKDLPADLAPYNPVLLGFWRDLDDAPEEMRAVAPRFEGKTIGCFATMGGDAQSPEARDWMTKTAKRLVEAGRGNTLAQTFLCRGRFDPEAFGRITTMMAGRPGLEGEEKRRASDTHPDRLDLEKGAELFRSVFGMNF